MCDKQDRPPNFLADAMLGGLARWLRVVGLNTTYKPVEDDHQLVQLADAEGRILLTRDRHLVTFLRPAKALLITADKPLEQLREVVTHQQLPAPAQLFTRCTQCNARLHDVPPAEAAKRVPETSRELPGPVRECPVCCRLYWAGSHTWRMRAALEATLPGWLEE